MSHMIMVLVSDVAKMSETIICRLRRSGRISIPSDIRRRLGLKEETYISNPKAFVLLLGAALISYFIFLTPENLTNIV